MKSSQTIMIGEWCLTTYPKLTTLGDKSELSWKQTIHFWVVGSGTKSDDDNRLYRPWEWYFRPFYFISFMNFAII